ncbi:MAG: 1,4-beta-xylanase [Chitinophagaceae bacterium]|nr:MAG: 1,4-beta-xylanase [Chitinophagaceae bacterium]
MSTTNVTVPFLEHDPELAHRWSRERAEDWMKQNSWLVGCNYIPSNAINQLEMWQEDTFSPALIDKELGWAASLGFNTVRVFLHHLLWEENAPAFINRIDQYLAIADRHGIRTMFVLFDAVWNPFPKLGKQPQPKHNIHNSGWVQCPGYDVLNNPESYDELHAYVNGIVSHFKNDSRVLIWDLYNEPDNMNLASYKDDDYIVHKAELSMELLKKTINWVRAINPTQPITMAPWQNDWSCDTKITALDNYMFSHSDIVSFHCYEDKKGTESRIKDILRYGRPMLCTEFMARPFGNTFEEILPLFKQYGVGAYNWGLVAGKTQTHCPWDSWQIRYENEPELWFHDIFREDGEPYIQEEVDYLRGLLIGIQKEELVFA